jgi:uncharacterized protein YjiS (DUF1127 family)
LGTAAPKSADISDPAVVYGRDGVDLEALEVAVKDAILDWAFPSRLLYTLVEIALEEITSGRPYFPSLRDESVFYRRYFKRWVEEAMQERTKLQSAEEALLKQLGVSRGELNELNGV